jgi:AcrR family transcriptional regulator
MPLSKTHKDQSRRRILDAAGILFRRHGFDGVGIDAIMAKAGLTRGGFYAHFASKSDLLGEVLSVQPALNRMLASRQGTTRRAAQAGALETLAWYLNPEAISHVASSCPMVSLSRDADRGGPKARAALSRIVTQLKAFLKNGMSARTVANQGDARALAMLALCVGGVTIARVADSRDLAREVLDACRNEATRLLGARPRRLHRAARVDSRAARNSRANKSQIRADRMRSVR